jgi:N-acetylornithine carbamoyltransferase
MGGTAIDIPMGEGGGYTLEFTDGAIMNGQTKEHIKEAARVISRYCDVIGVRASALVTNEAQTSSTDAWEALKQDTIIQGFMKYATVPVINLESNCFHPNQGMADALTITERLEQPQRKKYVLSWAYHPKPLPVATPHSQAQAAVDLGMEVQIVHPPGWDLDPEVVQSMQQRAQEAGGSVSVTNDRDQAYAGADVVCAKSWGSLEYAGNWDAEREQRAGLTDWIIDEAVMKQTNNAAFMHCLPMRRNVIATDAVVDSPQSAIIDEAENRMWAQLAVLQYVLTVYNNEYVTE